MKKSKKKFQETESELSGFPCEFRQICERVSIPGFEDEKKKAGRYSGSVYHIPGFGDGKWVVLAYLDIPNLLCHLDSGFSEKEVIEGCVEYLNQPPPRKKYQRRNRKPVYGTLELLSYKFVDKVGEDRVCCVTLATDQKKNKNFWGSGLTTLRGQG